MMRRFSHVSRIMTKPTNWLVRPAKTQISLGIRPVRLESSLAAWRKKLGPLVTPWAHIEDSDHTGRMPSLIWVFAGRTHILLVVSCCSSFVTLDSMQVLICGYKDQHGDEGMGKGNFQCRAVLHLWISVEQGPMLLTKGTYVQDERTVCVFLSVVPFSGSIWMQYGWPNRKKKSNNGWQCYSRVICKFSISKCDGIKVPYKVTNILKIKYRSILGSINDSFSLWARLPICSGLHNTKYLHRISLVYCKRNFPSWQIFV